MSCARVKTICMLATMLALGIGCSAQAPRVIAQKMCNQLDQSFADHDLNRVLGFVDSNFVLTDEHQKRVGYAEWCRQLEQNFPLLRRMNPRTTVEHVELEADRMVVYYTHKGSKEQYDRRVGWILLPSQVDSQACSRLHLDPIGSEVTIQARTPALILYEVSGA